MRKNFSSAFRKEGDKEKKTSVKNKIIAGATALKDNILNVDDVIKGTMSDYKKNKKKLRDKQVDSPTKKKNKMTAAEMQAASLAAAKKTKGVEVSGGKKTKQGSYIDYPGKAKDGGGSTTAGNSVEHSKLRVKAKKRSITASEKARLAALDAKTIKAYKKMRSKLPGQS